MFKIKYGGMIRKTYDAPLEDLCDKLDDIDFCYAVLNKVSRSFAVVIQQLPECLKDPVCIFYLVLRGLDSVEDDMDVDISKKLPLLRTFHEKLEIDGWCISGVGDAHDYRVLLANFQKVIRVYKGLDKGYRDAISDITQRMGNGMADFAEKKVTTTDGYNLYCHYVAGLVGYGLSDLFAASGLEDQQFRKEHRLSNSMGLFLQKTNIIRDYLEDLDVGRTWWPDDIWSLYADKLSFFKHNPHSKKSLACLNHMVTDALQHVPDCLEYMSRIKDIQVFRFCAIPQVMAIATLAAVYNNPNVFKKVVKIRKGLSCNMMINTNDLDSVKRIFFTFAKDIERRIPSDDPSRDKTIMLTEQVKEMSQGKINHKLLNFTNTLAWIIFIFSTVFLLSHYRNRDFEGGTALLRNEPAFAALIAAIGSIAYIFGFTAMSLV